MVPERSHNQGRWCGTEVTSRPVAMARERSSRGGMPLRCRVHPFRDVRPLRQRKHVRVDRSFLRGLGDEEGGFADMRTSCLSVVESTSPREQAES